MKIVQLIESFENVFETTDEAKSVVNDKKRCEPAWTRWVKNMSRLSCEEREKKRAVYI